VYLAVALSAVLVIAAIIDQTGSRSLADHVTTMYAPYGKRPDPNLLYGLVYTVAVVGALLWLPVIRAVRSRRRSAPVLAAVVTTITAALALLLLASTEYGAQIFPPLWGILAFLPPAAGPSRSCCSVAVGKDEYIAAEPSMADRALCLGLVGRGRSAPALARLICAASRPSRGREQSTCATRCSGRSCASGTSPGAEHGEALMRHRKDWYYRREPRPGISVIGDRLLELASGGRR
jgi:hypothetical protein